MKYVHYIDYKCKLNENLFLVKVGLKPKNVSNLNIAIQYCYYHRNKKNSSVPLVTKVNPDITACTTILILLIINTAKRTHSSLIQQTYRPLFIEFSNKFDLTVHLRYVTNICHLKNSDFAKSTEN